ncbi:hypothetical protein N7449_004894 [Penicillium cf. viridicatum]|uniref:Uncharacterized protein n=1 Tax=Penicillium cf. viridicatum TaxID=2972119 RepID=A0A9W9MK47_9EURO|nr:hypothetical protein N7449_004894 [Penicillium cf. viridicatum]
MVDFRAWQAGLFLLEQWQENSSLSTDGQREQIFSEFVALGVRGRQPYADQQRRLKDLSVLGLSTYSQEVSDRLRTCYEPSSEGSWAAIQTHVKGKLGRPAIYNDPSLYNFVSNWEKIFLRLLQLLENTCTAEEYEEDAQESLQAGIEAEEFDAQVAEESDYDPEEDANPWPGFYSDYYMHLVIQRIHVVDATTLASECPNAGKVLVVWVDECGRVTRYSRLELDDSLDNANVSNPILNGFSCWANAQIGHSYEWDGPLGPPYGEDDGETSE